MLPVWGYDQTKPRFHHILLKKKEKKKTPCGKKRVNFEKGQLESNQIKLSHMRARPRKMDKNMAEEKTSDYYEEEGHIESNQTTFIIHATRT